MPEELDPSHPRRGAGRLRRRVGRTVLGPLEARLARVVREEVDRAIAELRAMELRSRRDIISAGERDAATSSARFAEEVMPTGRWFGDAGDTLLYALEKAPRGGMALEFGVWAGRSLRVIAEDRDAREVYGFDSFQGLPEDYRWDVGAGTFALDRVPDIPGAELVIGWFSDTLPGFLEKHAGPVDFVHIDSDLYSSAVTVLDLVGPRLIAGSVLMFDEFFNYSGWEKHEYRAWQEWLDRTGTRAEYLAYTSIHEQVVVRVVEPGPGLAA
jgi:predicted O-methyltransferase YrrM